VPAFASEQRQLNQGDMVIVECDRQCNIRLVDDNNFEKLRNGNQHKYYGGFYRIFPARLVVPRSGHWNVVIDLGGQRNVAKYCIRYLTVSDATATVN
jgi:hypothetical protein